MPKSYLPNLLNRKRRQNETDAAESATAAASKEPAPVDKSTTVSVQSSSSTVATEEDHTVKGGRLMGAAVKKLLKHFDSSALGLKVELGETRMNAMYGTISIDGLTIYNPEGFSSEYLLRASKLVIDLDMQRLITSWGKTLELEKVIVDDVDVIYEKSWSSSNVDTATQNLNNSKYGKVKQDPDKVVAHKVACSSTSDGNEPDGNDPELVVHKVVLSNIGGKACTTLGSYGPRFAIGDICYEDFEKETGAQNVMDGISLVLETLLKSIVASVIGKDSCKSAWGALTHGKTRVRLAVSSMCEQIQSLCDCSSCQSCQRGDEVLIDENPGQLA